MMQLLQLLKPQRPPRPRNARVVRFFDVAPSAITVDPEEYARLGRLYAKAHRERLKAQRS